MAATFYIKQNDTAPSIQVVLTDSNGRVKSLANASSVRFNMSTDAGVNVIAGEPGSIINPTKGIVSYEWQAGDTANVGPHNAEFEIVYVNGQVETFPNSSYIKVIVKAELA